MEALNPHTFVIKTNQIKLTLTLSFNRKLAAIATLLYRQKPIGSASSAWCPGGLTIANAESSSPLATFSAAYSSKCPLFEKQKKHACCHNLWWNLLKKLKDHITGNIIIVFINIIIVSTFHRISTAIPSFSGKGKKEKILSITKIIGDFLEN